MHREGRFLKDDISRTVGCVYQLLLPDLRKSHHWLLDPEA
jgi:hypothetical protein